MREKHLARPFPCCAAAAHKPRTVIITSLARLELIPIGLTVRKVFQDSLRILLIL